MNLVSFDALRTLKLPGATYIKPELYSPASGVAPLG
jgi:hypothetical protein